MKIYALCDPITKELRYIGKTIQPIQDRYSSHISASKHNRKKDYTHCWIKSLLNKGLKPDLTILEENEIIEDEIFYISYLKSLGIRLTNHTEGGDRGTIGYRWKISKDILLKYKYKNAIPIYIYNRDGKQIEKFKSGIEFSDKYKISRSEISKFTNRNTLLENNTICSKSKVFPKTYYISRMRSVIVEIDNKFIEFKNTTKASEYLKIDNSTLSKILKGTLKHKHNFKIFYKNY